MPTKSELEAQIKELKSNIRDLKKKAGSGASKSDNLANIAVGILRDEEGFKLVKLHFEGESAAVGDIIFNSKGFAPACGRAKTLVVDEIIRLNKEKK